MITQSGGLPAAIEAVRIYNLTEDEIRRFPDYERRFINCIPQVRDVDDVIANWGNCVERKDILKQKKLTYEALKGIAQTSRNRETGERERN